MGVTSIDGDVAEGSIKIGPVHHAIRNLAVVLLIGGGVALAWWAQSRSTKLDTAQLAQFDAFRAAYAERCNVPAYAGPVADVVRDDVLTSPAIRGAIAQQLQALNAGASCEQVMQSLKKVDFAVPPPGPAPTE